MIPLTDRSVSTFGDSGNKLRILCGPTAPIAAPIASEREFLRKVDDSASTIGHSAASD
jgi:hypothetical protein